jgi:hypothetical protein
MLRLPDINSTLFPTLYLMCYERLDIGLVGLSCKTIILCFELDCLS